MHVTLPSYTKAVHKMLVNSASATPPKKSSSIRIIFSFVKIFQCLFNNNNVSKSDFNSCFRSEEISHDPAWTENEKSIIIVLSCFVGLSLISIAIGLTCFIRKRIRDRRTIINNEVRTMISDRSPTLPTRKDRLSDPSKRQDQFTLFRTLENRPAFSIKPSKHCASKLTFTVIITVTVRMAGKVGTKF